MCFGFGFKFSDKMDALRHYELLSIPQNFNFQVDIKHNAFIRLRSAQLV